MTTALGVLAVPLLAAATTTCDREQAETSMPEAAPREPVKVEPRAAAPATTHAPPPAPAASAIDAAIVDARARDAAADAPADARRDAPGDADAARKIGEADEAIPNGKNLRLAGPKPSGPAPIVGMSLLKTEVHVAAADFACVIQFATLGDASVFLANVKSAQRALVTCDVNATDPKRAVADWANGRATLQMLP